MLEPERLEYLRLSLLKLGASMAMANLAVRYLRQGRGFDAMNRMLRAVGSPVYVIGGHPAHRLTDVG